MRAANQTARESDSQKLADSLEHFVKVFYFLRTGRKFEIPDVPNRISHFRVIIEALERVFDGKTTRLIINVPPRYGKTELIISFIAWSMAQYPDSNHMYISYSHALAKKQTQTIREIMQLNEYRELFNVRLKEGTQEKSNFETEDNGVVLGLGAQSGITGKGAGLKGVLRYGGGIFIDDIIKPEDALSDTIRESTNEWFYNTLISRVNSPRTPIVVIGQRTHEDDLCARLIESGGWELISLPALDGAENALYPEMHDQKTLFTMREQMPFVFATQYQQNPCDASNRLFNPQWFPLLDEMPKIISTFITCDTAETDKEYNDATVFSFWGVYKAEFRGVTIQTPDGEDLYCLHWIDCHELRVEPKDLESVFLDFYSGCMRFKVKPRFAAIEKKSTGATLVSVLDSTQGISIIDIERAGKGQNKAARFLEMQPYIAAKRVSLPSDGKHTQLVLKHMSKITATMVHRFDDVADTAADAIRVALRDSVIVNRDISKTDYNSIAASFNSSVRQNISNRRNIFGK